MRIPVQLQWSHLFCGGGAGFISDHRHRHLPQEAGRSSQVPCDPPARHLPVVTILDTHSSVTAPYITTPTINTAHLQQILGQVGVWEAGGHRRGSPDDRLCQVQQSDVTVEGESMEVRMNEDLLDLYQLLARIRPLLVIVSCTHTYGSRT